MKNKLAHHYHLGEGTVTFRDISSDFELLFHFSIKFLEANIIVPDGTPQRAASHLGLYCLLISHK